jgi:hypothetical protein
VRQQPDGTEHVVGFATLYSLFHPRNDRMRLSQILVLPPYQGIGAGKALVQVGAAAAAGGQEPGLSARVRLDGQTSAFAPRLASHLPTCLPAFAPQAMYSLAVQRDVLDVTAEDPTDALMLVREKVDCERLLGSSWVAQLVGGACCTCHRAAPAAALHLLPRCTCRPAAGQPPPGAAAPSASLSPKHSHCTAAAACRTRRGPKPWALTAELSTPLCIGCRRGQGGA